MDYIRRALSQGEDDKWFAKMRAPAEYNSEKWQAKRDKETKNEIKEQVENLYYRCVKQRQDSESCETVGSGWLWEGIKPGARERKLHILEHFKEQIPELDSIMVRTAVRLIMNCSSMNIIDVANKQ